MGREVVIVGAGLAGLTAAAVLAGAGVRVVVIDEEGDVGGRLKGLTAEGFVLDAGLHCFDYGEAGALGELNTRLGLGLSFLTGTEPGWIMKGKDLAAVPEAEGDAGRPEDERVRAFLGKLKEAKAKDWMKKSVAEFLAESGAEADEAVSDYAGALCLAVLGRNAAETSAGAVMGHARAAGGTGLRAAALAGGPGALVRALAGKLGSEQVRLVLGSRVQGFEVRKESRLKPLAQAPLAQEEPPAAAPAPDGEWVISRVVTSSDRFEPAAVIYTGPPGALPELVPAEALPAKFAASCGKLAPVAGIGLELGLSARVSDAAGVLLHPTEAVIARFASNLDPSLAPEGQQLSAWLALIDPVDLEDKKLLRGHIMRLKRIIKRQFPTLLDHVRIERLRIIPAVTVAAPTPKQADKKLPGAVKGIQNLFLAGDGIGPGLPSAAAVRSATEATGKVRRWLDETG